MSRTIASAVNYITGALCCYDKMYPTDSDLLPIELQDGPCTRGYLPMCRACTEPSDGTEHCVFAGLREFVLKNGIHSAIELASRPFRAQDATWAFRQDMHHSLKFDIQKMKACRQNCIHNL